MKEPKNQTKDKTKSVQIFQMNSAEMLKLLYNNINPNCEQQTKKEQKERETSSKPKETKNRN